MVFQSFVAILQIIRLLAKMFVVGTKVPQYSIIKEQISYHEQKFLTFAFWSNVSGIEIK